MFMRGRAGHIFRTFEPQFSGAVRNVSHQSRINGSQCRNNVTTTSQEIARLGPESLALVVGLPLLELVRNNVPMRGGGG